MESMLPNNEDVRNSLQISIRIAEFASHVQQSGAALAQRSAWVLASRSAWALAQR